MVSSTQSIIFLRKGMKIFISSGDNALFKSFLCVKLLAFFNTRASSLDKP